MSRASEGQPSDGSGASTRRRLLIILVVLILALVGAGVGSVVLDDDTEQPAPSNTDAPEADETVNVSLVAEPDAQLLRVGDAVPGSDSSERLVLRNVGSDPGALSIVSMTVTERENNITAPEASVDSSPQQGELGTNFLVRLQWQPVDGEPVWLYGTADGPRPLSDLSDAERSTNVTLGAGESASLVAYWTIPEDVGNEIQSDAVHLNATFQLRATNTTLSQ